MNESTLKAPGLSREEALLRVLEGVDRYSTKKGEFYTLSSSDPGNSQISVCRLRIDPAAINGVATSVAKQVEKGELYSPLNFAFDIRNLLFRHPDPTVLLVEDLDTMLSRIEDGRRSGLTNSELDRLASQAVSDFYLPGLTPRGRYGVKRFKEETLIA